MVSPTYNSWRMLLQADQASKKFPRLAMEILDAQRQNTLDVSQFAKDEATQLIELIDARILQREDIPVRLKSTAFGILRRLCGAFQQLPDSCLIGEGLKIDDGIPFATRTYADLRKGKWKEKGVAVKLLRFSASDDRVRITKRFCKEIVLWKRLRHKNLLPLYGACMTDQFGMVSPWLENGNIVSFTRKNPEVNRLRLLIDVAHGLEYLHRNGVPHGNLRGFNILISNHAPPRALLSDYGLTSIIFDPFSLTRESINWTAPELLSVDNDTRGPSPTSDIYALAMVVHEVLTGAPPFASRQKPELACEVVLEGKRPPRPKISESLGITNELWDLLELCWAKDPSSRPTVKQVVGCLEEAARNWKADDTVFLIASEAGVQEVMNMEHEKVQKIADDLDEVLDRVGVSNSTRKYLRCLQKLCGVSGVLPQSFVLGGDLEGIGKDPFNRGGSSEVYMANYKGQAVVVKALKIDAVKNMTLAHKSFAKEVIGWKWLRHDNILPFIGVTSMPEPFQIVSPWMEDGNIVRFLKNCPDKNPFDLLVDVTDGLQYLHDHDFVHGDLKGANILIDSQYRARLADFGLARVTGDPCTILTQSAWGIGTIRWSAPEYLDPEKFGFGKESRMQLPSKSTDIYALGMTIFEVITRRRPFDDMSEPLVTIQVIRGDRPKRPTVGFSDVLWGLLVQSWCEEYESTPPRRPSISQLRAQLEQDCGTWASVAGALRASSITSTIADDAAPSSPASDTESYLESLLEQVQEFFGIEETVTTPTPIAASSFSAVPSLGPLHQVSPRRLRKAGTPTRWSRIKKFLEGFGRLRDRFRRASREPVTLSRGLVPEREENAEIMERRYVNLFACEQSERSFSDT